MHALLMKTKPWKIVLKDDELNIFFPDRFNYNNMNFSLTVKDLEGFSLLLNDDKKVIININNYSFLAKKNMIDNKIVAFIEWNKY